MSNNAVSFQSESGFSIPTEELDKIVTLQIASQPAGIASNGDAVAIADYFFPGITLWKTRKSREGLGVEVSHIRGARFPGMRESVRLWEDVARPGGANRSQTVNFGPDGTLWVTRNGERAILVLAPPTNWEKLWSASATLFLPEVPGSRGNDVLHSALLLQDMLGTIESSRDLEHWTLNSYQAKDGGILLMNSAPSPQWRYGIASKDNGHTLLTITDLRSHEEPGIYNTEKGVVLSGIHGNGICFLSDGSAIITQYGWASKKAMGDPGAIVFVPARMLS